MSQKNLRYSGSNAEQTRQHNRCVVLEQIRRAGRLGRAQMARNSGLSVQAVSNIIASLEQEGLLIEDGLRNHGRGLPSPQYALRAEGGFTLGFEIRPDSIRVALLDLLGELQHGEQHVLEDNSPNHVCHQLQMLRQALIAERGLDESRLLGAGVVMPGPFLPTGLADTRAVLPRWQEIDARAMLAEALSLPVMLENDANAAALGEQISGCTSHLDNYAYLYFGTGIGLGIVSHGRLFRGSKGNAGELGQIRVPVPANPQLPGNGPAATMLPLEDVAGRAALIRCLADAGQPVGDDSELEQRLQDGDRHLHHWLHTAAAGLSHAVHVVENLFDPETVVLGGALPDALLGELISLIELEDRSAAQRGDRIAPRLMQGHSGELSAARGGAALILNNLFTPRSS